MKALKKILAFTLLALMLFSLCATASADNTCTITILNSYWEKEYRIYKILDVQSSADGKAVIYYTTQHSLFEGSVTVTDNDGNSVELASPFVTEEAPELGDGVYTVAQRENTRDEDVAAWIAAKLSYFTAIENPNPSTDPDHPDSTAFIGNGHALKISGLPYGYYYIESTMGSVVTLHTANRNIEIFDKNESEIEATKTVNGQSFSIGDTITFTATFKHLPSYINGDRVIKYVIKDTLPPYLSDVTVTSIRLSSKEKPVQQFDENHEITFEWSYWDEASNSWKFYYNAPNTLYITYTAVLTDVVNINAANTNTVSITPYVDTTPDTPDEPTPASEPIEAKAVIYTYAAALKKTDMEGNALTGAQFTITGLTVEQKTDTFTGDENNTKTIKYYEVVSYDPTSTTESAVLETNEDGMLYIVGLGKDVKLTVTEIKAPDGYKITGITEKLTPQVLTKEVITTTGTRYYDEDHNLLREETSTSSSLEVSNSLSDLNGQAFVVKNATGATLPETGGMGTAAYYALGALLLAGAIALALTKRRSHNAA